MIHIKLPVIESTIIIYYFSSKMKFPILALLGISGILGTPPWHFARHHRYQSIARTPDAVVTLSMMKGKLTAGNIGQQLKVNNTVLDLSHNNRLGRGCCSTTDDHAISLPRLTDRLLSENKLFLF